MDQRRLQFEFKAGFEHHLEIVHLQTDNNELKTLLSFNAIEAVFQYAEGIFSFKRMLVHQNLGKNH
jgi:hypothetical protein